MRQPRTYLRLACALQGGRSVIPKVLKTLRREFGIANGMGDVLVTQVVLDGTGILAAVGLGAHQPDRRLHLGFESENGA